MSNDYSQEQALVLDGFGGQNNYIDPTKIDPREFTSKVNFDTSSGNIKAITRSSAGISMPGPVRLEGTWTIDQLASKAPSAETLAPLTYYLQKFSVSIAANVPVTLFVGLRGNFAEVVTGYMYDTTGVGGAPGNVIGSDKVSYNLGTMTSGDYRWVPITVVPNSSVSSFWIGFYVQATGSTLEVYTHADASGANWLTSAGAAIGTTNNPVSFLYRSSTPTDSDVDPEKIVNVELPYYNYTNTGVTISNSRTLPAGFPGNTELGQLAYIPDDVNYPYRIITQYGLNDPVNIAGKTVYLINKANVCYKDGVIYLSHFGTKTCVIIGLSKNEYSNNPGKKTSEFFDAVVFNGNLCVCTWGNDQTTHSPMYLSLNGLVPKSYDNSGLIPDLPKFIGVHNLSLFYTADMRTFPYNAFSLYYSEAGQVDNFNGVENISLGSEIITQKVSYNKIFFFFNNHIKELSGSFGNASLQRTFSNGTLCLNGVVETPYGLFMLSDNGLFRYGGSWQKTQDLTNLITTSKNNYYDIVTPSKYRVNAEGKLLYSEETNEVLIQLYDTTNIDFLVSFNCLQNTFGLVSTNTTASLLGNVFIGNYKFPILKNMGILYPKVTFVDNINIVYPATELVSGWIDPLPEFEKKILNKIVIEGAGPDIKLTITLDEGSVPVNNETKSFSGSGELDLIEAEINAECRRFKYKITSNAGSTQLNIARIKFYYTLGLYK